MRMIKHILLGLMLTTSVYASIFSGTNNITSIYAGTNAVKYAYAGTNLVWSSTVTYALISDGVDDRLDTGVNFATNSIIEFEYKTLATIQNYDCMFGSFTPGWQFLQYISPNLYIGIGSSSTADTGTLDYDKHIFKYDLQSRMAYFDSSSYSITGVISPTAENIVIFWENTNSRRGYPANLYYLKIWLGDTLSRDFVVVPKDSTEYSSTPAPSNCLWDKVTEAYFENLGTGEFGIEVVE